MTAGWFFDSPYFSINRDLGGFVLSCKRQHRIVVKISNSVTHLYRFILTILIRCCCIQLNKTHRFLWTNIYERPKKQPTVFIINDNNHYKIGYFVFF